MIRLPFIYALYIYVHARPKVLDVSIILTLRCYFRLKRCSYVEGGISDKSFVRFVFFFLVDIPSVDLVVAVFI